MSGIAIRQALTLGLNLLNSDKKLMDSSKEIRYRLWWAIASTERALSVMTGRPTCFVGTDCSAPLPLPLEEESFMSTNESYETPAVRSLRRFSTEESNLADGAVSTPASISSKGAPMSPRESLHSRRSQMESESEGVNPSNGLFFLYITKLSCLNDNIMRQLYRPPVMEQSWATVQSLITGAQKKLMRWHATLPGVFDFTKSQRDQSFLRQRMCLGFSYYSTMILINRPSLCKIDERIPNETKRAKDTDRASAVSCVLAAKSLVDLLPDEPNPVGTYQVSLWWNIVHHLMQAATVLMLEMSLRATHCPDMPDDLMNAAQKAVAWLQSMSADDLAAARAWRMSSDVLRKVAPKIGRKMDDRLTRPVQSGGEMSMQDLLMPDGDYPMPGPSDYGPTSGDLFAGYPPITSWEPLMFTSYDNYLSGGDPSGHQQGPSHNQWG